MAFIPHGCLPAHTLRDYVDWKCRIELKCLNDDCGRRASITSAEIATRFERALDVTMVVFGERVRCSACGGRDGHINYYNEGREASGRRY